MIVAQQLGLKYPNGTEALKSFDLKISEGEIAYIVGPSGSGKTSFLKMLIGETLPTSGSLSVMGVNILPSESHNIQLLRQKIGPVFQDFKLIFGYTVYENIALGLRFLNYNSNEMKNRTIEAIDQVGLSHKKNIRVDFLSYGECQRVAIARAIARSPKLIVADEPTGNLDYDNSVKILKLITSLKEKTSSVVISTHATHLLDDLPEGKLISIENGAIRLSSHKGVKR